MKTIYTFVKTEKKDFPEAVNAFLPSTVVIPFDQMRHKEYKCIVSKNDTVREGQIIAVPIDNAEAKNVAINASVPGTVTEIVRCHLSNGKMAQAVKIKMQGSFSYLGKRLQKTDWKQLRREDVLKLFMTKGICNTFSKPASLTQQILSCTARQGRFLVVRLFDEDPSRSTDTFVAKHYTDMVTEGAAIVASALDAQGIIFLTPKRMAIPINNELVHEFPVLSLDVDDGRYPVGFAENIIPFVKKCVKNTQNEFFYDIGHQCIFIDPETLFAVYEAVVFGIPLTERFVHVGGDCLHAAALFRVKIGTPLSYIARQCGGFKSKPAKIIVDGLVTGHAAINDDVPLSKSAKSVLFMPAWQQNNQTYAPCIRCGRCRSACPEGIFPDLITDLFMHQREVSKSLRQTARLCSQCSLCNAVCPSRLPISHIISLFKEGKQDDE